jgi:hypothetical protein
MLSPTAWVRTTSDLIARILQGILTTRNSGPDREPPDHDEFKRLFKDEDWEAIKCNLINLDHLSKIFPSPLQVGDPSLTCGHCLHWTNPESSDRLTWEDYQLTLMATDRSQSSVIGHIKRHLLADIDKDIQIWIDDETTRNRNKLHPRLQKDKQIYYTQRLKKISQEQDRLVEVNCQEYYDRHLLELKKDANT